MSSPSPELARRHNNLDALRIAAALAVIVGHSYPLTGRADSEPWIFGTKLDHVGIYVFFAISGYLITKSWIRRPRWGSYLAARSLRIFPGLIVVTLLTMGVLGPIFTTVTLGTYVKSGQTWDFLNNIILRPRFFLPGVFDSLPDPGAINGSLWSLPVEFACYLLVPIILLLPGRVARTIGAAAFLAISAVLVFTLSVPVSIWGFDLQQAVLPWIYFAAGMIVALAFRPAMMRLDVAAGLLVALIVVTVFNPVAASIVMWFVLPYSILAFGLHSTPVLRRASRFGDFSYGMYIYAFPVQQSFVALFGVQPLWIDLIGVILPTLALSFLSWHLVESPSLRLKARIEQWSASRALGKRPGNAEAEPQAQAQAQTQTQPQPNATQPDLVNPIVARYSPD